MPRLQAMATMAWLPTAASVSNPRTVSTTGEKGSYWENCRSPSGMVAVRTNPLPRKGSRIRNMGVLLAVSTLLAARPRATASQISANANRTSTPIVASHANRPGCGAESETEGDPDKDGHSGQGLDQAAEHVTREDRCPGDGHSPEPVDDASRHVHGDHDRGALNGRGHGYEQHPWYDVVEVGAASVVGTEAGAELAP